MSDQIYREQLLDHYHNPRNHGRIEGADRSTMLENLSCGDKIEVFLDVNDEEIKDIKFEAEGCAICIATASMLSEEIMGKTTNYANELNYDDLIELIGIELSPSRIKCAHLSLLAIQKAIA